MARLRSIAAPIAALAATIPMVVAPAAAVEIYREDFNAPSGTRFPEWSSSVISYNSAATPPGAGTLQPPAVMNCESPRGKRRFLGEFGGPKIGTSADPGYNRTAVEQTIHLTLENLPPHRALRISFDLLILKSWDGNSPQYGPDRLRLAVVGGQELLNTSFSNNLKVERQGSYQDFPTSGSAPHTSAQTTNTLGFNFFGDSIYHLSFDIRHDQTGLELQFTSQLFEGKGTDDESWGLDNLRIEALDK